MPTRNSGVTRKSSGKARTTAKKRATSSSAMESVLKRRNRHLEDENERLRETLEVLSDKPLVRKLMVALKHSDEGKLLTEEEFRCTDCVSKRA